MSGIKPAGRDHIATLDLLRLVAALAVVFFHYFFRGAAADGYLAEGYQQIAPFAIYGYLGVNLFFLISGFVIAWSAEGRSWEEFAVARFARLYPGFALCMSITFVVMALTGSRLFPASLGQYAANLSMFAPAFGQPFMDGAYWSIVLEVIFYGWMAVALFFGVFQRLKLELILGWLVISALNEFLIGSGSLRLLFLTEFGPLFAAGVLMHHIHTHGRSREALLLMAAAFLISSNTMIVSQQWMQGHYGVALPLAHLLIANLVMHGMLAGGVLLRGHVKPSSVTLTLGGLTYPLYLLHQHIGYVTINAAAPLVGKWIAAAGCIALIVVVSWVIWRYFERPAQRFVKDRLGRALDISLARIRNGGGRIRPAK